MKPAADGTGIAGRALIAGTNELRARKAQSNATTTATTTAQNTVTVSTPTVTHTAQREIRGRTLYWYLGRDWCLRLCSYDGTRRILSDLTSLEKACKQRQDQISANKQSLTPQLMSLSLSVQIRIEGRTEMGSGTDASGKEF